MFRDIPIRDIYGKTVPDDRGDPMIEVEVLIGDKVIGRSAVVKSMPAIGFCETEVLVDRLNAQIAQELIGVNVLELDRLDSILKAVAKGMEGTEEENDRLILGVLIAAVRAVAQMLEKIAREMSENSKLT